MANTIKPKIDVAINPFPNTAGFKTPTVKALKSVLGTYEFQGSKWAFKAPVGFKKMVILKTITLQKSPSASGAGDVETIKAHVLRNNRVIFEKTGGLANLHQFLGPVDYKTLPRGVPPGVAINPMPNR